MIPVVWVSKHKDIIARGYWDQALIETVFDHSLWRPAGAFEFEHHVVGLDPQRDFPDDITGAIVVVPARHHVNDHHWLQTQLDRLDWCILMLFEEEEWLFPFHKFAETDKLKVWTMQSKPQHAHLSVKMPCGFYPQTREYLESCSDEILDKPLDWMFAGQNTNSRRNQLVESLKKSTGGDGYLCTTDGYLHGAIDDDGLSRSEYYHTLASAKIIPCPSGPESPCTARVEEALEAGCVPIVDLKRPGAAGVQQFDYWTLTFGEGHPLRGVESWDEWQNVLTEEIQKWPVNVNEISSWWQGWKRDLTYKLRDQIIELSGLEGSRTKLEDKVTVIVTTSPASLHPDTRDLEAVLQSVREQLPSCEIILVADGVRPEQEHIRDDYEEYLRRSFALVNKMRNTILVRLPEWVHQANVTKAAMKLVRTPYIVFMEHDTPLYGSIDWDGFVRVLESGEANAIRLHFDVGIHPDHESIMKDHDDVIVAGVPLRRTKAWWQRPHIASAKFYNEKILSIFADESRTMIEDVIYGVMLQVCEATRATPGFGSATREDRWDEWKVWIYTPPGDMKRSGHLDTRGPDPKYGMRFIYEGEKPFGAPVDTEDAHNFQMPGKPREG